jgi:hypothetical protein
MAMAEQEWLACDDPDAMLEFLLLRNLLEGKASERRLRLLPCASCRRQWSWFVGHSQRVVEVVELYADRRVPYAEVHQALAPFIDEEDFPRKPLDVNEGVAWALADRLFGRIQAQEVMRELCKNPGGQAAGELREREAQARLARDIFGNPFRPAKLNRAWRTSNVTALAQSIYDDRAFDRLPILADALEDAGCDNADILNHCRQPGEHVRGCWVVDLVLQKE